MRRDIVVNGRFLSRRVTGVERYGRGILSVLGTRLRVEKPRANGIAGHAWEQLFLPAKIKSKSILWSPANTGPLFIRKQALTIHDLSPLEHPEWFQTSFAAWYRLLLPLLARTVRVIFTPSEYVKKKVMQRFGISNVVVTPNGVDTCIFHPGARHHVREIPEKYILFVGSIQPRKNLSGLVEAWQQIRAEFRDTCLVIAGEPGHVFRSTRLANAEQIRVLNYVSDDDLPGLYAGAELFVLPSWDEGFGLPALEAMACGAPVLVSNTGALPEVVGEAAMIFDAANHHDLSAALQYCLQNKNLRRSLKEKGPARARDFSWQNTADTIWNTLNEI